MSHQSNKWWMICDLSSPSGHSVNDGILRDLCSLQYASVNDTVRVLQRLARGAQLIKLCIQETYRIVPVHPSDYNLLTPPRDHWYCLLHEEPCTSLVFLWLHRKQKDQHLSSPCWVYSLTLSSCVRAAPAHGEAAATPGHD